MQQFAAKKIKISVRQCSYFSYMHCYVEKYIVPFIFRRYRYFQIFLGEGIHIAEGISGFELPVQINVVKNSKEIRVLSTTIN